MFGLKSARPMQASINSGNSRGDASSLRHSRAGILLVLVWCYFLLWGLFIVVSGLRADSGDWGLGAWLMIGAVLIPILLIPRYLYDCARRKQAPGFKPWLPWVFRLMCLSIILAMVDSWAEGTDRRDPLFSYRVYKLKDGGTGGSVGLGYSLTYYRAMGGAHGPEVWFWFTPFTVSWTTEHVGLRWLWQR